MTILNVDMAIAGVVLLALGVAAYVVYRRREKHALTRTAERAIPKPVTAHAGANQSVLVALDARGFGPQTIATACKLAAAQQAIHVLVIITIPQALPIDAELAEEESDARALIEQARLQTGLHVTGHVQRVRSRHSGRLIVEAARELHAATIVMALPPRTRAAPVGRTVRTVLADSPCRVIIEYEPALSLTRRRVAARTSGDAAPPGRGGQQDDHDETCRSRATGSPRGPRSPRGRGFAARDGAQQAPKWAADARIASGAELSDAAVLAAATLRRASYYEVRDGNNELIGLFGDRAVALVTARETLLNSPRPRPTALIQSFDDNGDLLGESVIALKSDGAP